MGPIHFFVCNSLNAVRSLIGAGPNVIAGGAANGTWDGNGIMSTSAHLAFLKDGSETMSIGYALNGDLPLGAYEAFANEAVSASDVIVRYTRNGDATLDGVVGDDDITILAALYDNGGTTGHGWGEGDFNYDGKTDDTDATVLAAFYSNDAAPVAIAGAVKTQSMDMTFTSNFTSIDELVVGGDAAPMVNTVDSNEIVAVKADEVAIEKVVTSDAGAAASVTELTLNVAPPTVTADGGVTAAAEQVEAAVTSSTPVETTESVVAGFWDQSPGDVQEQHLTAMASDLVTSSELLFV